MRKTAIALLALGLVVATTAFASNPVRFSQVYGGGGGSSSTYKNDYVELFNASSSPVTIGGWWLQYGSGTSTTGFPTVSTQTFQIPPGAVIQPCGYYLIKCGSAGSGGVDLPVTPDATTPTTALNMGATAGKLILVTTNVARACLGNYTGDTTVMDLLGWGAPSPNGLCYETAALTYLGGNLSAPQCGVRKVGGMTDTDNNSSDFTVETSFTPRNSASPLNPDCLLNFQLGACCVRYTTPGTCIITTLPACQALPGIFMGVGTQCQPTPPCAVPTDRTTWGKVKTIYR